MLSVGSVCSGAGGFDIGFRDGGYRTVWLCEFDAYRQDLLRQNFPGVPVHPDLTELDPGILERPTVLIGGTPCQDLSNAGNRAGLDGERSRLFWDFMRVRNHLGVEWCVWENVAGALSSNDGLDFAQVLAAMVGADVSPPAGGWPGAGVVAGPWGGAVWRLLDAQHFGVPQRRRRVFVVGRLGGPCPPEVLLEPAGGAGDSEAGEQTRPRTSCGSVRRAGLPGGEQDHASQARVAATITAGTSSDGVAAPGRRQEDDVNIVVSALDCQSGGADDNSAQARHLVAAPLLRRHGKGIDSDVSDGHLIANTLKEATYVAHTLRAEGFDASEDGTGRGTPLCVVDHEGQRPDLGARSGSADHETQRRPGHDRDVRGEPARRGARERDRQPDEGRREARTGLSSGTDRFVGAAADANGVRTADGLAGSLDGASSFDPQPDGRRYAACGDGVAAPVAEWIARRLADVIERQGAEAA